LGCKLANILKSDRTLATTNDIRFQWDSLVKELARSATMSGPILIILDAFDESGDAKTRRTLLSLLTNEALALPTNFRILVTSRLEYDVQKVLRVSKVMQKLMESVPNTSNDILHYVQKLMGVNTGSEVLNNSKCLAIVEKSENLFLYASITCKFICGDGKGGKTPEERFEGIISITTGSSILNALYLEVLQRTFDIEDPDVVTRFEKIMSYLLAAYIPLSKRSLATILQYSDTNGKGIEVNMTSVNVIIDYLGSLLIGVSDDLDSPLHLCHATLREFLTDQNLSGDFFVDMESVQGAFTSASIKLMSSPIDGLQFNICKLPTSYLPNNKILGLEKMILKNISPVLSYCCHYWAQHLNTLGLEASNHFDAVSQFLNEKFLYWLEVLSLLSGLNAAYESVSIIKSLLEVTKVSLHIYHLFKQTLKVLDSLGSNKIEKLYCRSKSIPPNIWKSHQ
jgi:hypothetical protein